MVTIQVLNLINFVAEVFSHSESSTEEAKRIATYLTTANLTGHDSHGVRSGKRAPNAPRTASPCLTTPGRR